MTTILSIKSVFHLKNEDFSVIDYVKRFQLLNSNNFIWLQGLFSIQKLIKSD